MTCQIGRITGLPEPTSWENAGDQITVTGSYKALSLADGLFRREQFLGYAMNPDEPVVPVIVGSDPGRTGFYRILSVDFITDEFTMQQGNLHDYRITMVRMAGYQTPSIESTLVGALIPNPGIAANSALPWHGVPAAAIGYYIANPSNTTLTRVADDGTVRVTLTGGAPPTYNQKVLFGLPAASFYTSAAQLRTAVGPALYQANAKDGTLSAPWVAVADGASTSGTAAKLPSGTVGTNQNDLVGSFTPPPGPYQVLVRIRQGAAGTGGNDEIGVGLALVSGGTSVTGFPYVLRPIDAISTYRTYSAGVYVSDGVTPVEYRFRALNATTTVDWYVDIGYLQTLLPAVGMQPSPTPGTWQLSNGLVRFESHPAGDGMQIAWYNGTSWGRPRRFQIVAGNHGALTEDVSGIRILRNAPEEVIVRVIFKPTAAAYPSPLMDIALRRGARTANGYIASKQADTWNILNVGSEAFTTITDGVRMTANDRDGNRPVIMTSVAFTAVNGLFSSSSLVTMDFGIGNEVPGATGTAGDTAQDLINEYVAGQGERQMVVVR